MRRYLAEVAKQKSNPKRNHHVLPALYLKGFVISLGEPFIWVYRRGERYNPGTRQLKNNPCKRPITKITARDFYAYPSEDGTKDFESYENFLENVEKPADRIFKKLRSCQPITPNERQIFCVYLVQMLKRVRAYRESLTVTAAKVAAEYELPDDARRNFNLPDNEETKSKVKEIALRISRENAFPTRTHLKTLSSITSSLLLDVFAKMSWRFFVAPAKHAFLTGDNPVFFTKRIGLKKLDSEVSFPISSEICLVASNRKYSENFIEASTQILKELNRRTASHASEHLYSRQREEWIVWLLNKKDHALNYIH